MQKYISLLRGINVSGQKMIKMAELKSAFEELKFKNVQTYIQSGNVIFEDKIQDNSKLSSRIAKMIKEKFGFDVPVTILKGEELSGYFHNNPFLKKRKEDVSLLHLTLFSDEPDQGNVKLLSEIQSEPDEFILSGKAFFLFCPAGYGNTKLTNTTLEKKLKVSATTRNWKTISELHRMVNE